mmetsp:Transcript_156198/g.277101  ORF Transcript_156198/g.277101 Transcript_156198/m.277101 type:complete len:723 (-) Transcript_156198:43-2211(-)
MDGASRVSFKVVCADVRYDMGHHVAICRFEKKCPNSSERTCCLGTLQTNSEIWPAWITEHTLPFSAEVEYKFLIVRENGEVHWELAQNRFLYVSPEEHPHDCFTVLAIYGMPGHQILSGYNTPRVPVGDRVKNIHAALLDIEADFLLSERRARMRADASDNSAFDDLISQFVEQVVGKPKIVDLDNVDDDALSHEVSLDFSEALSREVSFDLRSKAAPSIPIARPVVVPDATPVASKLQDTAAEIVEEDASPSRSSTKVPPGNGLSFVSALSLPDSDRSEDSDSADGEESDVDFNVEAEVSFEDVPKHFYIGDMKDIPEAGESSRTMSKASSVKKLRKIFEGNETSEPSPRAGPRPFETPREGTESTVSSSFETPRLPSSSLFETPSLPSSKAPVLLCTRASEAVREEKEADFFRGDSAASSETASEAESYDEIQTLKCPEYSTCQMQSSFGDRVQRTGAWSAEEASDDEVVTEETSGAPEDSPVRNCVPEETPERPKIKIPRLQGLETVHDSLALATREKLHKNTQMWASDSGSSAASESALARFRSLSPRLLRWFEGHVGNDNGKKDFVQRVIVACFFIPIPRVISLLPRKEEEEVGEGFQHLASPGSNRRRVKVMAAIAVCGTVAGGGIGSTFGTFVGGASGGIVGLVAAPFTLGLSIPVGAVVGGSVGFGAGATGGSGLGLAAGLLAGRMITDKSKRQLCDKDVTQNLGSQKANVAGA